MPDDRSPRPQAPWTERAAAWFRNLPENTRAYATRTRKNIRARLADDDPAVRAGAYGGLGLAALTSLALLAWLVLLFFLVPTPRDLNEASLEEASVVYTADGEELTRYQLKNRRWVPLDSISTHVIDALIATEDHRFYRHQGIDVLRFFGAIQKTVSGSPQGGSTISMQLARNAYPEMRDDFVLWRKLKEWLTALRVEDRYEKNRILEMYLNTVPFIYNAFGIEAAAQTYFQKSARALNEIEAAVLVGMLKGTVYYNPVRNPERSRERRNVVLDQMVKHGYMDRARADSLKVQETPLRFRRPSRAEGIAPHFAEYVRRQIDEWAEQRGYNLYTDGLKIHTTLDSRLQAAAQQAAIEVGAELQAVADVEWSRRNAPYFSASASNYIGYRDNVSPFAYFWGQNEDLVDRLIRQSQLYRAMAEDGTDEDSLLARFRADAAFVDSLKTAAQWLDVGFVAVEPHSGHVRAWVGGRDFDRSQYDHVAQARRQPGSTFKPFAYAAAIERGWRPTDRLPDSVSVYRDPGSGRTWRPTNVGGTSGRLLTLADALAYSKNTVTARLVAEVGPQRVADVARRLGIESELDEVPSIGLGTSPVTLLEMARAYAALADQGRTREPTYVTRIENRYGRVLATFAPKSRSGLSSYTAYTVVDMMRGVVDYGTGQRIRSQYGAQGDFAAKTGTSQNGADGWFMLMHPRLVAGAWVGFTTPRIHFRTNYWGQGAHNALHVVGRFFREARQQEGTYPDVAFEAPPGWEPPPPPDTLSYADTLYASDFSYEEYDSIMAYTDSILAVSDSMLSGQWTYEVIEEREREETTREAAGRRTAARPDTTARRLAPPRFEEQPLRAPPVTVEEPPPPQPDSLTPPPRPTPRPAPRRDSTETAPADTARVENRRR